MQAAEKVLVGCWGRENEAGDAVKRLFSARQSRSLLVLIDT